MTSDTSVVLGVQRVEKRTIHEVRGPNYDEEMNGEIRE